MDQLSLLEQGTMTLVGQVIDSSNATFLVELAQGGQNGFGIYKPQRGERPLWDFEPGLYRRERAAYLLSQHLGWPLVPPTAIRADAPLGVGSVQWYVEADQREHYFSIVKDHPETHDALRMICLFDLLANNTDRKSGYVLYGADQRVYGIDQGLCFAAQDKLRTVIWDFAGEPIAPALLAAVEPLAATVPAAVAELLSEDETEAVRRRAQWLLQRPVFPTDTTGYGYPWPLI